MHQAKPTFLKNFYNKLLQLRYFPKPFKTGQVILFQKKEKDPNDPASFRPICLLPAIGKIYEKLLVQRIKHYLEIKGEITDSQYGFREQRSTIQALSAIQKGIYDAYDSNNHVAVLSLDLKSAFDSLWWPAILEALHDAQIPDNLYCRFAILILMITNVNAKFPGSSHDSFVWRSSGVRHALSRHHETGSWLLGDAGYPLEPWLLTPVSSPTVGSANERYNKKHATARNCIERCIGVLKSRFRCLLHARELNYEPTTAGKIVNACAVLHNICRHYKLPDVENDCREEPWGPIPPTVFEPSLRAAALKIRDNLILTRF
ncbi:putative nuclease HARBI1 [Stegodyphus dumicola]|uniref:putative nuclease HARBI1 n=1 Tax=Stegodyphus dumicola TaxID=202533 RepID=UPI0015A985FB|nr:putative nuclease HARBI1 [Stegodyphus dumicola]